MTPILTSKPKAALLAPVFAKQPFQRERQMSATASSLWYKHIWPWIIIGMLTTSVALTMHMVFIAADGQDTLVTDNYYEAGKGISRSLDRERLAKDLHLEARATLDEVTGEVSLLLSGDSRPQTIEMNLISPTQAEKDRNLTLKRSTTEPDRYIGQVNRSHRR